MATYVGSISEFKPDTESVMAYLKRMKLLLLANEVPNEKHVAIFLSLLGGTTYGILRNLCNSNSSKSMQPGCSLCTQAEQWE